MGTTPYSLYFQCQLDALKGGSDNRGLYIGRKRQGLILSVEFEGVDIFTTFGCLEADELVLITGSKKFSELHVDEKQAESLLPACGERFLKQDDLLYYRLENADRSSTDAQCRILSCADFDLARSFFQQHYPDTIFSRWMLDLPFVGLFEKEQLVATGGTIIWHQGIQSCNLGNFLTHPHHRGKGLAKRVAKHLIAILSQSGMKTFTLGTNEENLSAQHVYESLGFELVERRKQISLLATRDGMKSLI